MKILPSLFTVIMALALISCQNTKMADLIVYNAHVYTVDENFSRAEAFAIKDGKIVAVGRNLEIHDQYRAHKEIDLIGKYVYPGLNDAHCHFFSYGLNQQKADLEGTKSFEEVLNILQEHDRKFQLDWVLGRGWDQNDWEVQAFPVSDQLDQLFPGKPVLITRIDGHAALANSVAMKMAGISAETTVDGGSVRLENGKPTGILIDNAIDLVSKLIPKSTRGEKIKALLHAQENCFAVGLTGIHDAGLGHESIQLIDSLQQSGKLKMRIYAMLNPGERNFYAYMYKGIYKTDYLNVRSIKLFADGALGSRGALMLEPYSDDPGNTGLQLMETDKIKEYCRKAYKYGYQVNTHCIGDGANRLMLDLYGSILKGQNDRRWRIEHAQVIHPDDFQKFGQFNIIPSVQTTHCTSDMYWAEERVGKSRIGGAYAYRKLLEQNGWLPNGSDFPVEHINPLYGYYAGITRKDQEGYPEGGFQAGDALTRIEALKAMTIWAAKSAFEENEKGSIEPGKFADFIVTDNDLLNMPEKDIPDTRILMTFIGGEQVYPRE
jgi:predicted amidohydrolase YtcJ